MNLLEHQVYENRGDALWNFLTRIHLLPDSGLNERSKKLMNIVQGNNFIAAVAIKIGIEPHPDKFDGKDVYGNNSPYPYADELEVRIYQEFLQGGFEQANSFYIRNVLPHCKSVADAELLMTNRVVPKFKNQKTILKEKKEATYELQRIDCNCNDCGFLKRNIEQAETQKGKQSPIYAGECLKFKKEVTFIPGVCSIENQKCFIHRKDYHHETQKASD